MHPALNPLPRGGRARPARGRPVAGSPARGRPVAGRRPVTTPARRRPLVGPLLMVVGAVHTGLTPVLFPDSVQSVVGAGVVNSIESDPETAQLRGLGFWYTTTGLGLIFTGWTVRELERRAEPTPAALPLFLAGLGAWGIALMPKSPFWVFLPLAALAAARRRESERDRRKP